MEAVIYCRISKDASGEHAGVARQEAECRELAERIGWRVADVYVDNDLSASKKDVFRPAYERLLTDVKSGRVQALLAFHPDRLYRRLADLERLVDAVGTMPIRTVQAGDVDLTTASGRMVARMLGVTQLAESERMSERIRAQKREARAAGGYLGGARPFGFRTDGTVIEEEAAMIRRAAEVVLAGESLRALTREWNANGLRTVRGAEWRVNTIRRVLERPRTAGFMAYGKVPNELTGRPTVNQVVYGKSAWPAILDEVTWRSVKAIFEGRSPGPRLSVDLKYQGSGFYLCGVCGSTLTGQPPNVKRRMGYHYKCNASSHLGIDGKRMDDAVRKIIIGHFADRKNLERFATPAEDFRPLHAEKARLVGALDERMDLFDAGAITAEQLTRSTERLRGELAKVESRLSLDSSPVRLFDGVEGSNGVAVRWDGLTPGQRSGLMRSLFRVVVFPVGRGGHRKPIIERIEIEWLEEE